MTGGLSGIGRQEREGLAVARADRSEISFIHCQYPANMETLGSCDHGRIGQAQIEVTVQAEQLLTSSQIGEFEALE